MNTTDLQEFSFSFASLFASQRPVPTHAFTELPTVSQATPEAPELRLDKLGVTGSRPVPPIENSCILAYLGAKIGDNSGGVATSRRRTWNTKWADGRL